MSTKLSKDWTHPPLVGHLLHFLRFLLLLIKNGVLVNFLELGLITLLTFHLCCLVHLLPNRSLPSPSIPPRATRGGSRCIQEESSPDPSSVVPPRTRTGPLQEQMIFVTSLTTPCAIFLRIMHFLLLNFSTYTRWGSRWIQGETSPDPSSVVPPRTRSGPLSSRKWPSCLAGPSREHLGVVLHGEGDTGRRLPDVLFIFIVLAVDTNLVQELYLWGSRRSSAQFALWVNVSASQLECPAQCRWTVSGAPPRPRKQWTAGPCRWWSQGRPQPGDQTRHPRPSST